MSTTPHDALFRAIFSQPSHAKAELQAVLPSELQTLLRLDTLAPLAGSFVDASLRATCADLLFSVELRDGGPVS